MAIDTSVTLQDRNQGWTQVGSEWEGPQVHSRERFTASQQSVLF